MCPEGGDRRHAPVDGQSGCPLDDLGLRLRVHGIRNYEKLTTSGMHVLGSDTLELVEEVLPRRHGGAPTDYQLVEEVSDADTRIAIVVSNFVPDVNEGALLRDVKAFLAGRSRAHRMMINLREQGGSLRVVRAEPHTTSTGKTPPLRVVEKPEAVEADRVGC